MNRAEGLRPPITLTLLLSDPPTVAIPERPTKIPTDAIGILAKALNTVTYGVDDDAVDGSAEACDDFWLSDLSSHTVRTALLHLSARHAELARLLGGLFGPILDHAAAEHRMLDVVREGSEGPELRLSTSEDPVDPRRWTYRRMSEALTLMDLSLQENSAAAIVAAAEQIGRACIDSRAARDAERLSQFATTMSAWNDHPVLICRRAQPPA